MPSTSTEPRPANSRRRARLVGRVALAGAWAAALGGVLAALASGVSASRLVAANEDREMLLVTDDFADEIDEELDEPEDDDSPEERAHFRAVHGERTLANILEHELEDLKYPGASVVVRLGAERVGDLSLPEPPVKSCVVDSSPEHPRRVCSMPFRGGVLTLGVDAPGDAEREALFFWAILLGIGAGALIGGVSSLLLARWALAPLTSLGARVRRIRPEDPTTEGLAGEERFAEVEELRHALEELVTHLGQSLKHAQSFAAQAAHELRTPLTALGGEVELLLERASTSEDRADLERIRRQLASLTSLVQRLLVLAADRTSSRAAGRAVDLGDVLAASFERFDAVDRARLRVESEEDVLVRGDEDLLGVLVKNAAENALKFSSGAVRISARARGDEALVEVVDEGPGIPAAEREQVFLPFYRSSAARASNTPGHGIGLALIAHVTRAHGGRAEFLDVERGTHLSVRLPRWALGGASSRRDED